MQVLLLLTKDGHHPVAVFAKKAELVKYLQRPDVYEADYVVYRGIAGKPDEGCDGPYVGDDWLAGATH